MNPVILPDAEKVVTSALRTLFPPLVTGFPFLADVAIGTKFPRPGVTPTKLVMVRRSGGVPIGVREDAPRLDFRVWYQTGDAVSDDEYLMATANMVRSVIYGARNMIAGGGRIGQMTEFVGPGRFDDPVNPAREIILFTAEIFIRADGA